MNPKIYFTEFASPVGTLQLRGTETALTGVFMKAHRHEPARPRDAVRDEAPLRAARQQMEEYFAGERREFSLALDAAGTEFQQRVWQALRAIPYSETVSYGDIARRIGNPRAVRAVGLANGRNPISIIVPCHRVIGANGSLTGYGGGLERKRFLLAFESGSGVDLTLSAASA
jgi:methylated-DNA-[protein]-cysteine S-methyltransferase